MRLHLYGQPWMRDRMICERIGERTVGIQPVMLPDLAVDLRQYLRMSQQVVLGILSALADLVAFVVVPRAALVDDIHLGRQIQHIAHVRDPLAEHDVELRLFKRRRDLVLHDADPGAVADHFTALL